MTSTKNVIEINGKRYDARTGQLIETTTPKTTATVHSGSIDGMTLRNTTTKRPHTAQHLRHHTPARSQTLLRSAVKKPSHTQVTKTVVTGMQEVPEAALLVKPPAAPKARLERARRIERSGLVQRFAASDLTTPVIQSVLKRTAHMSVKPAPVEQPAHHNHPQRTRSASVHQVAHRSIIEESLARARTHVATRAPRRLKTHQKMARKLRIKSRTLAIGASVLVTFLIGGFVAYQNIPSLEMRIAANRAGFDATLPKWSPSGFALSGPIDYKRGEVALKYEVPTDDREFELVQKPSDWTPDTLLNNYVVEATDQYQTYHDKGLTVYIYGGSNATWVDRGVWYTLEGNSQLSGEQIIDIAASL